MGCAFKSSRKGGSVAHRGLIILQPSAGSYSNRQKGARSPGGAKLLQQNVFFFSPSDMQIHLDVWTLGMAR